MKRKKTPDTASVSISFLTVSLSVGGNGHRLRDWRGGGGAVEGRGQAVEGAVEG